MGGGIGNEVFFLISGYLFSIKNREDIFKRFVKVYVPAYIMIIITMITGKICIDGVEDIIREFIWPTHFWFVGTIFLYSVILYSLINKGKMKTKNSIFSCGIIVIALDIILYIFCISDKNVWIVEDAYISFVPFRCIYSFLAFILGYYIKSNRDKILKSLNYKLITCIAIVTFVLFYGFKYLLNKGIVPMPIQIISQPLTLVSALCIFLSFTLMNLNSELDGTKASVWIDFLSKLSLESYLVQFLIIEIVSTWKILFPINFAIAIIIIITNAWLLHYIDDRLILKLVTWRNTL